MKYVVKTTPSAEGKIVSDITLRDDDGFSALISRWVIDTEDEQTCAALKKLGWAPPPASVPLPDNNCRVFGCSNTRDQGAFTGAFCNPCFYMLASGSVGPGQTFIHKMYHKLVAVTAALKD